MKNQNSLTEYILQELADKSFCYLDNFLPIEIAEGLLDTCEHHIQENNLTKAGIGKQINFTINVLERGDYIHWIENDQKNEFENYFFNKIEDLIQNINRNLFLGIKDYESHYAVYPKSDGYKKHRDRFRKNPHRQVSFVFYLNKNYIPELGGELVIYNEELEQEIKIDPTFNRIAFFLSEKIHEVLPSHFDRKSITGWMLDKPIEFTFLK